MYIKVTVILVDIVASYLGSINNNCKWLPILKHQPLKLEIKESYKRGPLNCSWDLAYSILNYPLTVQHLKTKLENCNLFSSRGIEGFKEGGKLSYISFPGKNLVLLVMC